MPEIEQRLNELRSWWQRHRSGEFAAAPEDEDPDPILRSRALITGLGVAYEANLALKRWQTCLDILDELEATQRALGEEQHALAITCFNKYAALLELQRLPQAQKVLEDCLQVFRDTGDLVGHAKALVALASVWSQRNDTNQALALLRHGLSILNHLPRPVDRATAHANLAVLLDEVANHDGPAGHLLASIAYYVVCNHHEGLKTPLTMLATALSMHGNTQISKRHKLPRLPELVALPEFGALQEFLTDQQVDVTELQESIDQLVEQIQATTVDWTHPRRKLPILRRIVEWVAELARIQRP